MCWHFWNCKQTRWLWISRGWGLKSIHPLKSHCTKEFKSYTIQNDKTATLFFHRFISSDLFNLCTCLSPLPPNFYTIISLLFHILSQNDATHEKQGKKRKPAVSKSQRTATMCFSGPHLIKVELLQLWGPQDTIRNTVQHKEDTFMCTQWEPQTQKHMWILTT